MITLNENKIFDFINGLFLLVFTGIIAYPLYFVLIASVSSPEAVNIGGVWLLPKDINFTGYVFVFRDEALWRGYSVTVLLTVLGTLINLMLTFTGAYALSKSQLPGMRAIMFFITFTMFFSGGLIPTYLLVSDLKLRNTIWALILPNAISVYNLILVRTYYIKSIPKEMTEAAKMDGCSEFQTLRSVVLPLCTPIIATMALFYGVGHWNQFFEALIYINDMSKYPLQLVLRNILLAGNTAMTNMIASGGGTEQEIEYAKALMQRAEILKYAVIIVSSLPILILYPFLQRYFVKGIMAGSLKG